MSMRRTLPPLQDFGIAASFDFGQVARGETVVADGGCYAPQSATASIAIVNDHSEGLFKVIGVNTFSLRIVVTGPPPKDPSAPPMWIWEMVPVGQYSGAEPFPVTAGLVIVVSLSFSAPSVFKQLTYTASVAVTVGATWTHHLPAIATIEALPSSSSSSSSRRLSSSSSSA